MPNQTAEFAQIARFVDLLSPTNAAGVIKGIGDDCAVLSCGAGGPPLLFSIDTMVEGTHFNREWSSFEDVGWKLAAANVSDIGAMGGEPWVAVVSCQVVEGAAAQDLDALYQGLALAAQHYQFGIVGGDTVVGREFSFSLALLGRCLGEPIYRSGAQVGDQIWVSGFLGSAWKELQLLRHGCLNHALATWHRRPCPPKGLGSLLAQAKLPQAMIDVSDGLLQDASHIALGSNVTLVLNEADIPLAKETTCIERRLALAGGDDYELLVTVPLDREEELCRVAEDYALTKIGQVEAGVGSVVLRAKEGDLLLGRDIEVGGYEHKW